MQRPRLVLLAIVISDNGITKILHLGYIFLVRGDVSADTCTGFTRIDAMRASLQNCTRCGFPKQASRTAFLIGSVMASGQAWYASVEL